MPFEKTLEILEDFDNAVHGCWNKNGFFVEFPIDLLNSPIAPLDYPIRLDDEKSCNSIQLSKSMDLYGDKFEFWGDVWTSNLFPLYGDLITFEDVFLSQFEVDLEHLETNKEFFICCSTYGVKS